MSEVSMDLIKKLRERSGVGMMDCKNALHEAGGDLEKAAELLRKKGMAVAAKRSANTTENGLITGAVDAEYKRASLVEIGCETDFAARTQDMRTFAHDLAESFMLQAKQLASIDAFMATQVKTMGLSAQQMLDALISKISEKIVVASVQVVAAEETNLSNIYLHPDGTLGVLVTLEADKAIPSTARPALALAAKDICMQVAVNNPVSISAEDVPAEVIAKEREIAAEQLKTSGKPAQMLEKIIDGKIRKYCQDNCLVEQKFIKDEQQTVGQYLEKAAKEHQLKLKVARVIRFGIKR